MRKHWKLCGLLVLQLLVFYVLPMLAGPADAIGMVLLIALLTFLLALLMGVISTSWRRFLYPMLVAGVFVPSVYLFYNESALVHAVWYMVIALAGVSAGALLHRS